MSKNSNKKIRILFFGLGSIGQRHAKILLKNKDCEIFAYRSHGKTVMPFPGIKQIYSLNEVDRIRPDVAFITNPTYLHIETALFCAEKKIKLFIEKPIGASLSKLNILLKEVEKNKLVTYVAYNLRFLECIVWLKKYLEKRKVYHVMVYNSSYLPKWRPNTKYYNSYSACRAFGGGILLDSSHEFDYLEYIFGKFNIVQGVFGKRSHLKVDTEDYADILLKNKRAMVNLHMNFFSLYKERSIKVDYHNGYVFVDLLSNRAEIIYKNKKSVKVFKNGIEKSYSLQAEYFLSNINNQRMMNNLVNASELFNKIIKFKEGK